MTIDRIEFSAVPQFARRDVAYVSQDERLRPFYAYPPTLAGFEQVFSDKAGDATDRALLVRELTEQYRAFPQTSEATRANIDALADERTFTVITAHQPGLFTGPLYFIYKICGVIRLAQRLNETYPDYRVVPVFISGGEDHDFEEINHARIFGQTISWEQETGGSVGKLPTDSLADALKELAELLGDGERARAAYDLIAGAYGRHETYGIATVDLVNELFGRFGLVAADMSRPAYKTAFRSVMEQELFDQVSQPLVEDAQARLTAAGFSGQAHAREINLFYLQDGRRDRIVKSVNGYGVVDAELTFSTEELRSELHEHPERFSPNVIMRPLFQESIFPNLAYVGGGGELAYWLERKEQFKHFGLNFPLLLRRNSVLWIDGGSSKRMEKLDLSPTDLLQDTDSLVRRFVDRNSENELSLEDELAQLKGLFESIAAKAEDIDPTLAKAVLAEHARQEKAVQNLEGRLHRTEKQRFDTAVNQIRSLRDKLFPNDGLQERTDNFLNIYAKHGDEMIDVLVEALDPLEQGLVVVSE